MDRTDWQHRFVLMTVLELLTSHTGRQSPPQVVEASNTRSTHRQRRESRWVASDRKFRQRGLSFSKSLFQLKRSSVSFCRYCTACDGRTKANEQFR